jgi:hypothetical protein
MMESLEISNEKKSFDTDSEFPANTTSRLADIQREYYNTHRKNVFFKKTQKQDCTAHVCAQMSLEDLLSETFWVIPNTNRLFFDYTVFKMYANPDNYSHIIEKVLVYCSDCVEKFGSFEVHVNLAGFTVSAAERYKSIITLFCSECLHRNKRFNATLDTMNLYNIPNMVDQLSMILLPLIPIEVRPKLRLYRKPESASALENLHRNVAATSTGAVPMR